MDALTVLDWKDVSKNLAAGGHWWDRNELQGVKQGGGPERRGRGRYQRRESPLVGVGWFVIWGP
jgi:hypothetical protein